MTELDSLVSEIKGSAKYRHVCDDIIRSLGVQEMAKRDYREAVKATRNKLHQIGGAYLDRPPHYANWLKELSEAKSESPDAFRAVCCRIMNGHASTRERLPVLSHFYADALSDLAPIQSVVDVACGFNPLAIPWMPLAPHATYTAIDIYEDLMAFLEQTIALCGMSPKVMAHSVLGELPDVGYADLGLVLKAIPCLEQVDKNAGVSLLEQIKARHLLVSFPVKSLGGRSKGMSESYEAHFREIITAKSWSVQRFAQQTELVFLVDKGN